MSVQEMGAVGKCQSKTTWRSMHIFSGTIIIIIKNIVHYSYSIKLFELLGLLQRNDPDIWTMGSGTRRPWKGISPYAVCSRDSGTVQD